jgi:hypothetical protein
MVPSWGFCIATTLAGATGAGVGVAATVGAGVGAALADAAGAEAAGDVAGALP